MKKFLKSRRFLNIFLLISLVGFLVFPQIALADDFENITPEEMGKYLELPQKDAQKLMNTLKQVLTTKGIYLWSSGHTTDEEIAAAVILLKVVKIEILNHLLVDAPIEITGKIIKGAVDIYQVLTAQNVALVLDKFEKETTERAIEHGMNFLFQNEIKVTPGAIKFKYSSYTGGEKEVVFQYIMIYQPIDIKSGKVEIRFYSPNPIEPPDPDKFSRLLQVPNLQYDLSPFIVEIKGNVDKTQLDTYKWTEGPSVNIDFPPSVPDLGIKPLSFWERYLLKPITSTIREVEFIITKVTGKSLKIVEDIFNISKIAVDIWNEIKSTFSEINLFSPAAVVQTPVVDVGQGLGQTVSEQSEVEPPLIEPEPEPELEPEEKLTLSEIQERLDDIAERIDIINREMAELVGTETPLAEEELKKEKEEEIQEEELQEEETEETEESEESQEERESEQEESTVTICQKRSGDYPVRNKVVINEVAWMGTSNSAQDEWIELKNISGAAVNLSGWQLLDKEKQIKIVFDNQHRVLSNGFFLLERTDDNSVPGITADLIYTGGLSNTNEALYLFDENCQFQDEVIANLDWSAGHNNSKRTMERRSNLSWQTSANPGGTPKKGNSSGYVEIISGGGGGGASPPSPSSPPTPQFFPVIINEIMYDLEGSDEGREWIEILNTATSEVDLTNWKFYENETNHQLNIVQGIAILPSNSYAIIADDAEKFLEDYPDFSETLFDSAFSLSNEGENIAIKNGDLMIDEVNYDSAWGASGDANSLQRTEEGNWETAWPTPGAGNKFPPEDTDEEEKEEEEPQEPICGNGLLEEGEGCDDGNIENGDGCSALCQIEDQGEEEKEETPSLEVVINEIAWMGTEAEYNDEWIELYNNTEEEIDLAGWKIKATDETPEIELTGIISPNDFYLLERTDDTTVSDVPADQIYTGALGNEGEELELWRKDEEGNLILVDKVSCKKDIEGNCLEWFAGDNLTKQTMERIKLSKSDFDNWANNNLITRNGLDVQNNPINGTPKAENSVSKTSTQISGSLPFDKFNEITLTLLGSPYLIQNTLTVLENTTLTIKPGVALKFKNNTGLEVRGTLKAIGGENKEITFTSLSQPAYWQGIYFSQTSFNSELNWTIVRYGKRSIGEPPAILVDNSSITFRNSILENYTDRGIKLVNSNSLIEKVNFLGGGITISTVGIEIRNGSPTIKNCDLIKSNKHGIFIAFLTGEALPIIEGNNFEENENSIYALNPNVIFKSNRAKNNILNGILIRCYFSQNLTWFLNDIPYVVEGFLEVEPGITLLINPGVIVKFKSSAYFKIKGTLLAQGSEEDPIVFTSLRDDYGGDTNNDGIITSPGAGNWGGLTFISGSDNSVLKNVIVSYGGYWHPSWFEQGLVSVMGSKIETDKFIAKYGSEAGLYLLNSTSIIKNSHFENNEIGLRIQGTEIIPQITDYHFENNERRDVYWPNGGENCQNFKELEIECSCCPYG